MAEQYCPDLPTFCDILRYYSKHGLNYFNDLPQLTQQSIRLKLGGALEDNNDVIERKLALIKHGQDSNLKFFPMPRPGGNDFRASFFLPRIHLGDGGNYTCAFVVVFWIERDDGKTMAIRLEPSEAKAPAHLYTHLQLTVTTMMPKITTDLADWIPQSYPAFPLGYNHPLQLFVGMAVAVHGYSANTKKEYFRKAIGDSMAEGNAALLAQKIFGELERIFGR